MNEFLIISGIILGVSGSRRSYMVIHRYQKTIPKRIR